MADISYPPSDLASLVGQPLANAATGGNVATSVPSPVGNTYRGLFSDWFNAEGIAREDWQRQVQAEQLAFERESQFNAAEAQKNRDFQSLEAQKNRDWQERMRDTYYQSAVEGMKASGINPVLALGSVGGPSSPSGSQASGSQATAYSQGGVSQARGQNSAQFVGAVLQFVGNIASGLISQIPTFIQVGSKAMSSYAAAVGRYNVDNGIIKALKSKN